MENLIRMIFLNYTIKKTHLPYRFKGLSIITLFIVTLSCEEFVEVDLPSSQLSSEAVFADNTTANAAMLSVYAKIRDQGMFTGGQGMSAVMGTYADELLYFGTPSAGIATFYSNNILASNSTTAMWWQSGYNQIYMANAIINGVENSTTLSGATREQLKGEALFLRAFIHFHLVNLFGGIPYIATTDYLVNSVATRKTEAEIYELIVTDLLQAESLLPAAYIGGQKVRANKQVARAFLSRVYLYKGEWALAANTASSVLNDTSASTWETNLDAVFVKESATAIWQLLPGNDGANTSEGEAFIFTGGPPAFVSLNDQLLNAFEPGDQRLTHWIKEVTFDTSSWYHPFKYKQRTVTSTSLEYSVMLRLAEQYLIRAEARARMGELTMALSDLNMVRNRAGLPDSSAGTQQEILDAIIHERHVELFTEHGHRFFDLKRTNKLDSVLGSSKPGWETTDRLLPLPEAELILNPNLEPQNPGY